MYTRPRVIPVLSIDDGDLVKTKNFRNGRYLGDPVNAVKIFNIKGVDEMAILDIRASKKDTEPDYEMLKDIAMQAFMPLSYGGGIRTLEQAQKLFAIGYEKIIVNTIFFEMPKIVKDMSDMFGSQSVVVSIDAKKNNDGYLCITRDGTVELQKTPLEAAILAEKMGAGEIIINSIDYDGMMCGYDIKLIEHVANKVTVPVIACGGAGKISDLKRGLAAGAHAVAASSMFVFYGRLQAVLINMPTEQELVKAGVYIE